MKTKLVNETTYKLKVIAAAIDCGYAIGDDGEQTVNEAYDEACGLLAWGRSPEPLAVDAFAIGDGGLQSFEVLLPSGDWIYTDEGRFLPPQRIADALNGEHIDLHTTVADTNGRVYDLYLTEETEFFNLCQGSTELVITKGCSSITF